MNLKFSPISSFYIRSPILQLDGTDITPLPYKAGDCFIIEPLPKAGQPS
jgi:hypothetical protein